MSSQAASISSLLSTLLLSDYRILQLSWDTPFAQQLNWHVLKEPTYLAYQPWAARYPDHVFDSTWRYLTALQPEQGVLINALKALTQEFLTFRHGELRVHRDLFGAWQQGVISRLSALPVHAAANILHSDAPLSLRNNMELFSEDVAPWKMQMVPLLRPEEAPVADYIEREGLHETHLHLNGSTHAEICWLRALQNTRIETRDFVAAWKKEKQSGRIRELIGQVNPELTPTRFHQQLVTANRLRYWLIGAANDQISPDARLPFSCQSLYESDSTKWSKGVITPDLSWRDAPDISEELSWMTALIAKLYQHPMSIQLSRMFHAYLLLLNQHYRLLVQSETQYGFDQFQKFTLTELREPSEKEYKARFHAIHGSRLANSKIGYLEGRFAPKQTLVKSYKLFKAILGGYLGYLDDVTTTDKLSTKKTHSLSALLAELDNLFKQPHTPHRSIHRLTLVTHFIKKGWSPNKNGSSGPYKHYSLINELHRATNVLLNGLTRWPRLTNWVRGIDAAANELDAPPDVFAPVFRVCHRAGLSRRTFHAGEDFRHILSGIATMREALELLNLRDGDRIGHGTAMGIRPQLWLDRMPRKIILPQGEWLLGVLTAWCLLRNIPDMQACVNHLQRELESVALHIFGRSITVLEIEQAMALRGLSRFDLMRQITGQVDQHHEPLNELWREEAKRVKAAYQEQRQVVELLWEWLSNPDVLQRADELVEKPANFLDTPCYIRLQQALMQEVAERGVLIETLPSSNVRISQYQHISEHHVLRWMRVPGYIEEGDPEIMVSLGSDDPGIFASNLETEFYLLYSTLRKAGLSDTDALHRLSILNERGRIYRFHHPMI
ncbi:hypothetical protein NVV56_19400 [Aeromonas dhakensis]|uniref:hypothetical protein n=1 Tax=Aeromonas dhakensis TaxID=196024 RepID=UPI002157D560|nr:hypothetical protein [Aeromonas dhakensis]MCR6741056.1 hypothetical protein [Aeromonas dhakensis]